MGDGAECIMQNEKCKMRLPQPLRGFAMTMQNEDRGLGGEPGARDERYVAGFFMRGEDKEMERGCRSPGARKGFLQGPGQRGFFPKTACSTCMSSYLSISQQVKNSCV